MAKISDKKYQSLVEKNAKHSVLLHVEAGNATRIAEAVKNMPVLSALEFLFALAEKHRKENRSKKVKTILDAVALIDRKTGKETDLALETTGTGKKQDTVLFIGKLTPAEIFAMKIDRKKHDIKELKKTKLVKKKGTKKTSVKKVAKKKVVKKETVKKIATKKSRS